MTGIAARSASPARPYRAARNGLWMAAPLAFLLLLMSYPATSQTFTVIHSFTGQHGGHPWAGPTVDQAGNVYGTTFFGGNGYGTVYKLTRHGSGWIFTSLYSFTGGGDGGYPYAGVTLGPDGALYGTTYGGGNNACTYGCGTVYRLRPPPTFCQAVLCPWTETVLYRFGGGVDGKAPYAGVIFDRAGSLYGTTTSGGLSDCSNGYGCGVVYELTLSGGVWTESVLYSFAAGRDGAFPQAGLVFDNIGNLYGATTAGGTSNQGTVFRLMRSGSGWVESILHSFSGTTDGETPVGSLILDASGNLYGTTINEGPNHGGTAYELSPSGGSWTFNVIYAFSGTGGHEGGPYGALALDHDGSLYGTTGGDGLYRDGTVFELQPSHNGWTQIVLHDFAAGSDGEDPFSSVALDADGNLFGTASMGGTQSDGVVFEVTPNRDSPISTGSRGEDLAPN